LQGGSGGIDWNAVGDAFKRTAAGQQKRPKKEEEEFYGFGAFFQVPICNLSCIAASPLRCFGEPGKSSIGVASCFFNHFTHFRTWRRVLRVGWGCCKMHSGWVFEPGLCIFRVAFGVQLLFGTHRYQDCSLTMQVWSLNFRPIFLN
jgi:hypothetical protein